MMHSNSFVLAIKDQSKKVLREIAGKVYLPFHSEYSLLLKNNNSVRACCSISIDGTDVLGGSEIILNSNSSIDLERFLVDGDLNKGNRFKFVPLNDSRVSDPSSPENGLIEVKFWKELVNNYWYWDYFRSPQIPFLFSTSKGINSNPSVMCCAMNNAGSPGATVEGSTSHQSFTNTSFGKKDGEATVIRIQLMGQNKPITVEKTKHIYCGQCGKSNPYSSKYCNRCGTKLQKFVEV